MLRRENINLIQVAKEVGGNGKCNDNEKNDPMVWDELYLGAEEMAADCGMEPSMLRLCVEQGHRINLPADT